VSPEETEGIGNDEKRGTRVGEDREPKAGVSEQGEDEKDGFNAKGEIMLNRMMPGVRRPS
jgi:hypothetical protein